MRINLKPLEAIIISLSLVGELASFGGIAYNSIAYIDLIKKARQIEINNPLLEIKESRSKSDDQEAKLTQYYQNLDKIRKIKTNASDYLIYGAASIGIAAASAIFLSQRIIKRRNRILKHWLNY